MRSKLDTNDDRLVSRPEFVRACMDMLGFAGPKHVLRDCFDALDDDKSGSVGFDELK